jgi:chlorophyll synthase
MTKENSAERSAKTRQLLGMKGAALGETSIWKIRLQLMKPITWIPLIWGVVCGAASSGGYSWTLEDVPQVFTQILVLLFAGIGLAYTLDRWAGHEFPTITCIAIGGAFLAYIYSAPPLKLKQNGWLGNYALGASYIALPWWTGHALFGQLNWTIAILTLFYSLAGLGIAVVNDFKSVEGDRQLGLKSLPVMFGLGTAAWICVVMIDVFQAGIAGYLISIHKNLYAAILLLLIIPQITFQDMYFLRNPLENDVKYQASAQPFLVLGMLVAGLALGHAGIS